MEHDATERAMAIAGILLDLKAVQIRLDPPFRWASGRFSPVYCDNRLILSDPMSRRRVRDGLGALIHEAGWRPEVIAGTATAGIAHAAWLAEKLDLPMVYIRAKAKDHGRENRIEGRLDPGRRVVVIEDLISTGGSSVSAALAVREAGGEVEGVASIFTYGLADAKARFDEAGIPFRSLCDFFRLIEEAERRNTLSAQEAGAVASWIRDPHAWSLMRGGA